MKYIFFKDGDYSIKERFNRPAKAIGEISHRGIVLYNEHGNEVINIYTNNNDESYIKVGNVSSPYDVKLSVYFYISDSYIEMDSELTAIIDDYNKNRNYIYETLDKIARIKNGNFIDLADDKMNNLIKIVSLFKSKEEDEYVGKINDIDVRVMELHTYGPSSCRYEALIAKTPNGINYINLNVYSNSWVVGGVSLGHYHFHNRDEIVNCCDYIQSLPIDELKKCELGKQCNISINEYIKQNSCSVKSARMQ